MGKDNPLNSDIIFRRTTLIVRDIEESLNLYGNILGMESIYDQVYTHGENYLIDLLKAVDENIGVIGLVDYAYDVPMPRLNKSLSGERASLHRIWCLYSIPMIWILVGRLFRR